MKKLLCIFILLLSVTAFALQKSGIKEYDELDLTKGEVITYMDKEGTAINDSSAAQYYRKSFGKMGNLYLFVDFYSYNDSPESVYKSSDSKGVEKMEGKYVSYYSNGSLYYIADIKNNEFHGKKVNYENEKISSIINFSHDSMEGNVESYIDGKIYNIIEYKNEVPDGKVSIYNSDGSIAVTQIYKNGEFVSSKNVNYKLQKTGIPEYDNLDIKENKIFIYYDMDKKITSNTSDRVFFYRKILKEENGVFLVADFLMYSDNILGISKVRNPKDKYGITNEGYSVEYCESGYLISKAFYKNGKLDGEEILYDNFGNPKTINTYKDGKLINTEYLGSN